MEALLQYWPHFMFWFHGCMAGRILALYPGIKPSPRASEGKVLTTGPLGKSLKTLFLFKLRFKQSEQNPEWGSVFSKQLVKMPA